MFVSNIRPPTSLSRHVAMRQVFSTPVWWDKELKPPKESINHFIAWKLTHLSYRQKTLDLVPSAVSSATDVEIVFKNVCLCSRLTSQGPTSALEIWWRMVPKWMHWFTSTCLGPKYFLEAQFSHRGFNKKCLNYCSVPKAAVTARSMCHDSDDRCTIFWLGVY